MVGSIGDNMPLPRRDGKRKVAGMTGRCAIYSAKYDFSFSLRHSRQSGASRYSYDSRAACYLRFRGAWCACSQTKQESQKMKKLLLSIAVAAAAPLASAPASQPTTSTPPTPERGRPNPHTPPPTPL